MQFASDTALPLHFLSVAEKTKMGQTLLMEAPPASQPIKVSAYNLKREADRWSEKNNPVISMAKRMAGQMAVMAQIQEDVGREDYSTSEMISAAKVGGRADTRHGMASPPDCSSPDCALPTSPMCRPLPPTARTLSSMPGRLPRTARTSA